jgi:O6-methylguanine-DNA--protein-cysteine methyltransferase
VFRAADGEKEVKRQELRKACAANGIRNASKMTVAQMKSALDRAYAKERLSDVVPIQIVKKAKRPSVTSTLQGMRVGQTVTVESVAKQTGAKPASVRMLAQSFNSDAPSNSRLYETGFRFDVPRGSDTITRTK